ncbi:Shedu immune nuclease family protein [Bacillus toyonensis]|uniref:Shedu immune nuclease family protein n=1 Tax=Bacillus toyonensis TaxID=155322 RepID=UPI000BFBFACA|nr:Shedu immune nuclease family protein [Bacillus toyonensis]PHF12223.1 hypothetical protein COF83_25115 [Bacillus toyonensis]PHF38989.1 hypothetical protein COI39_27405 [Bacillus toyonensis]
MKNTKIKILENKVLINDNEYDLVNDYVVSGDFLENEIMNIHINNMPSDKVFNIFYFAKDKFEGAKNTGLRLFLEECLPYPFNSVVFGKNDKGNFYMNYGCFNRDPESEGLPYNLKAFFSKYEELKFEKIIVKDAEEGSFTMGKVLSVEIDEKIQLFSNAFQYSLDLIKELNIKVTRALSGFYAYKDVLEKWNDSFLNEKEEKWQKIFEENPWILSTCLSIPYVFFASKALVGGGTIQNEAKKIADFVQKNHCNNISIIEIKKPNTTIFAKGGPYREPDIFNFDVNFSGAINQLLSYKDRLFKSFYAIQSETERVHDTRIEVLNSRSVLIIGSLEGELRDEEPKVRKFKLECFERFRNELRNIDIITYDELFEKIKLFYDVSNDNLTS